ncbi:MAG: hypothetical protein ACK47B_22010 [Armatimonadota bacterium]
METVSWGGWPHCLRLSDGAVELIVTTDVGPRIVHFGFQGGPNELREFPEQQGLTGGDEWHVFGGHRLWHAPEQKPRSYQPDNDSVEHETRENGVRLLQPVEAVTGIQKSLEIEFAGEAHLRLTHRLTNRGAWPVRLAPWALTVMAPGGTVVIPQPPYASPENLLPNRSVVLWPYTRPGDPRLLWGQRYLRVRPDAAREEATKLGTQSTEGWCAYVNGDRLFLKCVRHFPDAEYPDLNCGLECYTAGDFLELETLGPLQTLQPGESAEHVEQWLLFRGASAETEEQVDESVLPLVKGALARL